MNSDYIPAGGVNCGELQGNGVLQVNSDLLEREPAGRGTETMIVRRS